MRNVMNLVIAGMAWVSCSQDTVPASPLVVNDDFEQSTNGWSADFADYTVGRETDFQLANSHTALPAPLDQTKKAIFISGKNLSDDLFMYLKNR